MQTLREQLEAKLHMRERECGAGSSAQAALTSLTHSSCDRFTAQLYCVHQDGEIVIPRLPHDERCERDVLLVVGDIVRIEVVASAGVAARSCHAASLVSCE
jgi:hypothetical protein